LANVTPEEQEKYRQELLALQVCIIAPQTSYDITAENLYDYDLPPGLVTLRVARTVLNLYRRGGRLTPKSVLKLLRLGMKLLLCDLCAIFGWFNYAPPSSLFSTFRLQVSAPPAEHHLRDGGAWRQPDRRWRPPW